MDEERLAEIETYAREVGSIRLSPLFLVEEVIPELVAEVRRLQTRIDQAYSDGISSGHADIVGIIQDPKTPDDPAGSLSEIKGLLGLD